MKSVIKRVNKSKLAENAIIAIHICFSCFVVHFQQLAMMHMHYYMNTLMDT